MGIFSKVGSKSTNIEKYNSENVIYVLEEQTEEGKPASEIEENVLTSPYELYG